MIIINYLFRVLSAFCFQYLFCLFSAKIILKLNWTSHKKLSQNWAIANLHKRFQGLISRFGRAMVKINAKVLKSQIGIIKIIRISQNNQKSFHSLHVINDQCTTYQFHFCVVWVYQSAVWPGWAIFKVLASQFSNNCSPNIWKPSIFK